MKLNTIWGHCSLEAETKEDQNLLSQLYKKIKDNDCVSTTYNHDDAEQEYPIEIHIQTYF